MGDTYGGNISTERKRGDIKPKSKLFRAKEVGAIRIREIKIYFRCGKQFYF